MFTVRLLVYLLLAITRTSILVYQCHGRVQSITHTGICPSCTQLLVDLDAIHSSRTALQAGSSTSQFHVTQGINLYPHRPLGLTHGLCRQIRVTILPQVKRTSR